MLQGTLDLDTLAERAPTMTSLTPEPCDFEGVEVLQASFELASRSRESTLPPALHPTTPPVMVVLAWSVSESAWGPFRLVQARVSCRSGVRPRGFVAGAIVDSPAAATGLSSSWGLPVSVGEVSLQRGYHATELSASVAGAVACHIVAPAPDPLGVDDVQFLVTLTPAHTPRGLRLVQLEPDHQLHRVERCQPRLGGFDGAAFGDTALAPAYPISCTVGVGRVHMPAVRYVCRPEVMAFEGTEPAASA